MSEFDQQSVEQFRAMIEDLEERTEEQERALYALSGREREYVYWRIRWRRRELKVMRRRLADFEESVFAMCVLGDLKRL